MLSTILKSKVAVQVSIQIMDAFVAMLKFINESLLEQKYINHLVLKHVTSIKLLQESFTQFDKKKKIIISFLKARFMMIIL